MRKKGLEFKIVVIVIFALFLLLFLILLSSQGMRWINAIIDKLMGI